jgi:hypothetical protein
LSNAAVVEESTPPDMATTTLVSCGRPSRPKLLSMVPVIQSDRGDILRDGILPTKPRSTRHLALKAAL